MKSGLNGVSPYHSPTQNIQHPLMRPILGLGDEASFDWVLLHVSPALGIILIPAQAMVKGVRLPLAFIVCVKAAELALPKCDPMFEGKIEIVRSAEEMQMVRHQQIVAGYPCLGGLPRLNKMFVNARMQKPWNAFLSSQIGRA